MQKGMLVGNSFNVWKIFYRSLFLLAVILSIGYAKEKVAYTMPGVEEVSSIWSSEILDKDINNIEALSENLILATGKGTYTINKKTGEVLNVGGIPSPIVSKLRLNDETMIIMGEKSSVLISTLDGTVLQSKLPPLPFTLVTEIAPSVVLISSKYSVLVSTKTGEATGAKLLPPNITINSIEPFAPNTVAVIGEGSALISTKDGSVIVSSKENKLFASIFKEYKDIEDNPLKGHDPVSGYAIVYDKKSDKYQQYDMSRFTSVKNLGISEELKVREILAAGDKVLFQFKAGAGPIDWSIYEIKSGDKKYEGKYKFGKIQTLINVETLDQDGYLLMVCGEGKSVAKLIKLDLTTGKQSEVLAFKGGLLNWVFYNDGTKCYLKSARYGGLFKKVNFACFNLKTFKVLYEGNETMKWNNTINLLKVISGAGRGKSRSYPIQFDSKKDMLYQMANISSKNLKAAPGKYVQTEKLRWYFPAKGKTITKSIEGASHLGFVSLDAGLVYVGKILSMNSATNLITRNYIVGVIDPVTEKFIWKKKLAADAGISIVQAQNNIIIVKTVPGKFGSGKDGLVALSAVNGKKVPIPGLKKMDKGINEAEIAAAPITYAELIAMSALAIKDHIKQYKDNYRNDRTYGARTPIPGSTDYLLMSHDTLALWDKNDKLKWEIEGTIKSSLPPKGKKATVLFGNTFQPEINILKHDANKLYVVLSGAKQKVLYSVERATGKVNYFVPGFPILFKDDNLCFMLFKKDGTPGKAGNLKTTTKSGPSVQTTVLFGKGPIEGQIIKAFPFDPSKEVNLGDGVIRGQAQGDGSRKKRKKSEHRWFYSRVATGGGSILSYMASFCLIKQHLSISAGAGIGMGVDEKPLENFLLQVMIDWHILGAKKKFTPILGVLVFTSTEGSYDGSGGGVNLGVQWNFKRNLQFFFMMTGYFGNQWSNLGANAAQVNPLISGDIKKVYSIFALRPAIGIKF